MGTADNQLNLIEVIINCLVVLNRYLNGLIFSLGGKDSGNLK